MDFQKYSKLIGADLTEYTKDNPKQFLMNYKEILTDDAVKQKLELLIAVAKDINNIKIDKKLEPFKSWKDTGAYFQNRIGFNREEHFEIAYLNKKFELIQAKTISVGAIASSIVNIREIAKDIMGIADLKHIVTAHNHPSGRVDPSPEDLSMQKRINEICKTIGVNYLDNLIVSTDGYKSTLNEEKYRRAGRTTEKVIEDEEELLEKSTAKKLFERGSVSELNLEEKISVLTDLNTYKLRGVFYKKDLAQIFLTRDARELLQSIKDFADDISTMGKEKRGYIKVTSPQDVVSEGRKLSLESKEIGVIHVSAKCEVITGVKLPNNDVLKNIMKDSMKYNSYGVILVTEGKVSQPTIDLNFETYKNKLGLVNIKCIEYVGIGKDGNCYSAQGDYTFEVKNLNKVQEQVKAVEEPLRQSKLISKGLELEL